MSSSSTVIRGLLTGFTRLSKAIVAMLVVSCLVTYIFPSSSMDYLALRPAKTIPFAWNLLTAGFTERYPVTLAFDALALLYIGGVLEPIWGSKEFFVFILAVNLCTAFSTFFLYYVLFFVTQREEFLYSPICGFHGVVAGMLVGVKQLLPEQEITAFVVLKFRAKWVPSLFVVLAAVGCVAAGRAVQYLPFVVFGTYSGWLYLRFFQRKPEANLKGDPSDEFAFATFFPELVQPFVSVVATICGRVFCAGRRAAGGDEEDGLAAGKPLPGSDPVDANRRRERGARALEERLAASKAPEAPAAAEPTPLSMEPAPLPAEADSVEKV